MGLSRGRMRRLWLHQPKAQRIADGMEPTELKEGVGIALEAAGECRFRIAAPPERWLTHQRAVLKSI